MFQAKSLVVSASIQIAGWFVIPCAASRLNTLLYAWSRQHGHTLSVSSDLSVSDSSGPSDISDVVVLTMGFVTETMT